MAYLRAAGANGLACCGLYPKGRGMV